MPTAGQKDQLATQHRDRWRRSHPRSAVNASGMESRAVITMRYGLIFVPEFKVDERVPLYGRIASKIHLRRLPRDFPESVHVDSCGSHQEQKCRSMCRSLRVTRKVFTHYRMRIPTEVSKGSPTFKLPVGLPTAQNLINPLDYTVASTSRRPPCSLSSLCVARSLLRLLHYPDMSYTNDTFIVSSSTALSMGEHLVLLVNTVIQNLPESELRRMRSALEDSVRLADDLIYNILISSTFNMLTLNDGAQTQLPFCPYLHFLYKQCQPPLAGTSIFPPVP